MVNPRPEEHPYSSFIGQVRKPGQYLGGESGERRKDWAAVKARVCLAFPDLYEVGMSHLGFKILYGILNDHPELLGERAYAPWGDMEAVLRERQEPLRSLENWKALREFDVVGFSLQFELTYSNVLTMLELGGIPLRSADRDDSAPLVLAGGPVATHAEPMAHFFDALLVGDGEERTPELALRWAELRDAGVPRRERLGQLAELEGVYVPSLYDTSVDAETGFHVVSEALDPRAPLPVQRTFVKKLDAYPFPTDGPVAATETVFDRVSVEIARGCTEGCRFCQAGMIYRPVRERSPDEILKAIDLSTKQGGYDEASLTCLSTADYSAVSPLIREVIARAERDNLSISVSSLRAYGLGEDVLDEMMKTRATGLTFAPEAGSQRMRDVVNKNVTEGQLMETAERVFSRGWEKMKLYFMIGLPTEEEEDVREIVRCGARAAQVGRRAMGGGGGRVKVIVSVSTHVPKPHTPFQWCAMDSHEDVQTKQRWLREEARGSKIQLRMHSSEGSWLEGVLARGDRRLGDVIESAYRNGARFDSWQECLKLRAWEDAFATHEVEPTQFLGTIPVTARIPWDHIDVGLEDGFLLREYRKALRNRLSPPCGKAAGMFVHHNNVAAAESDPRRLVCYDCGIACDMAAMRSERLVALRSVAPPNVAPVETLPAIAEESQAEAEPGPTIKKVDRRINRRTPQGAFIKVRLGFTRVGRNAFGSHLDMVRLLPRVFRRAGLPLFYSEGFHPKPVMVLGPSLPVGTASLCEYIDLKLLAKASAGAAADMDGLCARLNEVSIEGVRFFGAAQLVDGDPPLGRVIDEVEYVAGISEHELADFGLNRESIQGRIAERMAEPSLEVVRNVKGIKKRVDVKKFLESVAPCSGSEVLAEAGVIGDLLPIRMRLALRSNGTARASEVLQVLLPPAEVGAPALGARFVRSAVSGSPRGEPVTPLELSAFRKDKAADASHPPLTNQAEAVQVG